MTKKTILREISNRIRKYTVQGDLLINSEVSCKLNPIIYPRVGRNSRLKRFHRYAMTGIGLSVIREGEEQLIFIQVSESDRRSDSHWITLSTSTPHIVLEQIVTNLGILNQMCESYRQFI